MKRKIMKFVTTNPGYKLLALVLAFAMWLAVYNSEDPSKTATLTAEVSIENQDYLAKLNECYQIVNNTGNVTFSVTAKRSILDKLDSSDFVVKADLSRLKLADDGKTATIPIDITATRYASSVKINGRTKYVEITIENLVTKQFVIKAISQGSVKEGYALGTVAVDNPNVLKVTGPEAVVEDIAEVTATIDVDGMDQSISDNVAPVLHDSKGEVINTTRLTLSNTEVIIRAQVLDTKEVKLSFSTSGNPAGNNKVLGVEWDPVSVMVKGSTAVLNKLTEITIPSEALNIEGATDDIETSIKITQYLPDNVQLVTDSQSEVKVTVRIQKYGTRDFNIATTEIRTEGLSKDLSVSYNVSAITVTVTATDEDLKKLKEEDIMGTIDLAGLTEGTHYVNLKLNLDEDKYTYTMPQMQVILEAMPAEDKTSVSEME